MKITLANLNQATLQQVFDQVANHLLTQGKKSLNTYVVESPSFLDSTKRSVNSVLDSCAYRGQGGLACAAGCLISDEEMQKVFDLGYNTGTPWRAIAEEFNIYKHTTAISCLQEIHDSYEPYEWLEELESFAQHHDLNTEVLNAYRLLES